ncbi:SIR2 family protein [Hymenobacter cellulosivorans]|uniref:SIR2 family protein n=1 Tax=Hymenobacter cellulosivorans TaxID=2932249 RepID=A0ABY4F8E2_9BACT|nr:SIR2 family protein [Hymenobacter cellulosivorans]UOQ52292.1 SIR2 family protein [Hymenobacter cellulosivorans]
MATKSIPFVCWEACAIQIKGAKGCIQNLYGGMKSFLYLKILLRIIKFDKNFQRNNLCSMALSVPNGILDAIRNNSLIVFVGSGMSRRFNLPDWKGMVVDIINLSDDIKFKSFIPVVQDDLMQPIEVLDKMIFEKHNIYSYIEDNYILKKDSNLDTHRKILSLTGKVITTNYDNAFEVADTTMYKVVYDSAFRISKLKDKSNYIFKIHGSSDVDPSECIIFSSDYERLYSKENAAIIKMKDLFINNTILFIGFSFNDPYVNKMFGQIDELFDGNISHYILTNTPDKFENLRYIRSIKIDDYGQIDEFIDLCIDSAKTSNVSEISTNVFDKKQEFIKPKLCILYPDPVDINLCLEFKQIASCFENLNVDIYIGYLNVSTLQLADDYDILIIITKIFKGKLYVEDENISSQLMSAEELSNYFINEGMVKIFITNESIDLDYIDSCVSISTYKSNVINKFIFKALRNSDLNFKEAEIKIKGDFGFKYNKGKAKYLSIYQAEYSIPYGFKLSDNLVGRSEERITISRKLLNIKISNKLLNIKGAGGTGKTTLIKTVAHDLYKRGVFKDGIMFVSCEQIYNYNDFELALIKGFGLNNIVNFKEYLRENIIKAEKLIILDNFESVLSINSSTDYEQVLLLLNFVIDYSNIVLTSREILDIDFEDVFSLSSMVTDDAVKLFELNYGAVDAKDRQVLRVEILENLLNNNPLAIKLVTKNTIRQKSIEYLKNQLTNFFFESTGSEHEQIYSSDADLNIEKTKSIYQSINYSYSKLLYKEKLAFEILHLFPDGISFSQFKKWFSKEKSLNRISDIDLKALCNKSLVENHEGILQLQPIIRKFSEFQFLKRDEDVKIKYYGDAFKINSFMMSNIRFMYAYGDLSTSLKMHDQIKNNTLMSLGYIDKIEALYEDKAPLLRYVRSQTNYIMQENQALQFKDKIMNLKGFFSDIKYSGEYIDTCVNVMMYYCKSFDSYSDLCEIFPPELMEDRVMAEEESFEGDYKDNISLIHAMEGHTMAFLNSYVKNNNVNTDIVFDDYIFYLGIHININELVKRFYSYERDYIYKILNTSELKSYLKSLYSEHHIEIMQCTYVLAKLEPISRDKISKLVVTNPYTRGLKELMFAFNENVSSKKHEYFIRAMKFLFHIKYYYLEALYYYCKFLYKEGHPDFEKNYSDGLYMSKKYYYQYMEYRFVSIKDSSVTVYQCDFNYYQLKEIKKFVQDYVEKCNIEFNEMLKNNKS